MAVTPSLSADLSGIRMRVVPRKAGLSSPLWEEGSFYFVNFHTSKGVFTMKEKLAQIRADALASIQKVDTAAALDALNEAFLAE